MLSKVPILNDSFSKFLNLIYSGSVSLPNNKELCLFAFHDMPINKSDKNKSLTDEMFFFLYLRSQSPSCFFENEVKEEVTMSEISSSGNINVDRHP